MSPELQNRFQGHCEMEFGILGSDDGMAGFSGWKERLGMDGGQVVANLTLFPFYTTLQKLIKGIQINCHH